MENENEPRAINWHAAFSEALKAELCEYRDVLEYMEEVPLTTEPLRIDVIVVKKQPGKVIQKNIAEIFRTYNIIEYKSPMDHFSVEALNKAFAYAHLFANRNSVHLLDITLTLIENRHPRKLLQYFKELGMPLTKKANGVYVSHTGMFPIQIIECKKLPPQENIWLRNLKRGVSADDLWRLIELKNKDRLGLALSAYLYAVLMANQERIERMEEEDMRKATTLDQVFEELGYVKRWETRFKAEGRAEGRAEGTTNMLRLFKGLKNNIPVTELAEDTHIPIDEIEKIKLEFSY